MLGVLGLVETVVTVYRVSQATFGKWLSSLSGRCVFAPLATAWGAWVGRVGEKGPEVALDRPRAAQSAKGFFMPAAETVARYGGKAGGPPAPDQKTVLVGVRACELLAWKYLDKVMLGGDFVDPLYKARRDAATIISCDCVACAATCCCVLVDGRPFVQEDDGADLNVTALEGDWLIEPLSDKGRELLASSGANWPAASGEQAAKRQAAREAMVRRLREQNASFTYAATDAKPPVLPEGDDDSWQRHAADCVECGGCTNICPTCHCFYLFDHMLQPRSGGPAGRTAERVRNWDSCLLASYHRMAGGVAMKLTPRPELRSRLANRILHKFVYSPQQYGMLGCVGCGRCVDACLGAIDIRKVVEDLKR